jgi:hypothetical protein
MDLHGRGINVWFEGLEGVQKIRDFVGVGSDWDTGSSDNGNTLGKEGTTGVSTGSVCKWVGGNAVSVMFSKIKEIKESSTWPSKR